MKRLENRTPEDGPCPNLRLAMGRRTEGTDPNSTANALEIALTLEPQPTGSWWELVTWTQLGQLSAKRKIENYCVREEPGKSQLTWEKTINSSQCWDDFTDTVAAIIKIVQCIRANSLEINGKTKKHQPKNKKISRRIKWKFRSGKYNNQKFKNLLHGLNSKMEMMEKTVNLKTD